MYEKYNKITDTIYKIDSVTTVTFNVKLNTLDKDNNILPIHREYNFMYHGKTVTNINRTISYFLAIERFKTDNNDRMTFIITVADFVLFRSLINEVLSWYTMPNYKELYTKVGGQLRLARTIQMRTLNLKNGFIGFEPTVYFNNTPGVNICLGDKNICSQMSLHAFGGLAYVINELNMVQYAATLLNYIGSPGYGYNSISMDSNIVPTNNTTDITVSNGNGHKNIKPAVQKELSFFDKINQLRKDNPQGQ